MRALQDEILADPSVIEVIRSRKSDGWLGTTFHGSGGTEASIRLLCEKGVESDCPVLADALAGLEAATDRLADGIGRVGALLDDMGLGGSRLIRAAVFAYAGVEDREFVREEIEGALSRFAAAGGVGDVAEITEEYRGKLVFREGASWPCIYDLRLLAFTHSWRSAGRLKVAAHSVRNLVRLSPIPDVHARWGSQIIAPASYCMHDFAPDVGSMSDAMWAMWFHRMEMLSRLGVVERVSELREQAGELARTLQSGDGLFTRPLRHGSFRKWGAYTGLMLERDWRTGRRRSCDLTFRSLLILGHAGRTS